MAAVLTTRPSPTWRVGWWSTNGASCKGGGNFNPLTLKRTSAATKFDGPAPIKLGNLSSAPAREHSSSGGGGSYDHSYSYADSGGGGGANGSNRYSGYSTASTYSSEGWDYHDGDDEGVPSGGNYMQPKKRSCSPCGGKGRWKSREVASGDPCPGGCDHGWLWDWEPTHCWTCKQVSPGGSFKVRPDDPNSEIRCSDPGCPGQWLYRRYECRGCMGSGWPGHVNVRFREVWHYCSCVGWKKKGGKGSSRDTNLGGGGWGSRANAT